MATDVTEAMRMAREALRLGRSTASLAASSSGSVDGLA